MSERLTEEIERKIDSLTGEIREIADEVVYVHQNRDLSFHDSICELLERGSIAVPQCRYLAAVFDTYWGY